MTSRGPSGRSARSSSEQPLLIGEFQRGPQIGKGSFAIVYQGRHIKKKSLAAIKSVELHQLSRKLRENLNTEIEILKSLQHPHIVAIMFTQSQGSLMHVVMEYCALGDLSQFIKSRSTLGQHPATRDIVRKYPCIPSGGLNEVVVRHFLKQIASAIEFLHSRNVIHRDLKPQNLLINPAPTLLRKQQTEDRPLEASKNSLVPTVGVESLPMLKIADFGFARFLPQTSLAETLCGSPLYMAPEILAYQKYDTKADLWSVGTVTFEMLVGKPPYRASNHVELLHKIDRAFDEVPFPRDIPISRPLKSILRALLKRQPTERLSFEDFFEHPVIIQEIPGLVGEDKPAISEKLSSGDPRRSQTQRISSSSAVSGRATDRSHRAALPSAESSNQGAHHEPASSNSRRSASGAPRVPGPKDAAPTSPDQQTPTQRPSMTTHATAPARQDTVHERNPVAVAQAMERRNSRKTPSPAASMLKEQLDRERAPQRKDDRTARETRERAAQDVAFERDYVLVEKRAVEVNAFADELAESPQLRRPLSPQSAALSGERPLKERQTQLRELRRRPPLRPCKSQMFGPGQMPCIIAHPPTSGAMDPELRRRQLRLQKP